ncbi:putative transcriptional regulator [Nocardia nova SH22a]|uniref:Putative transcriptional regulator n=1 Tax=Nocardia nova SH22a TaxID=1415166 RepID=W5TB83_9NOCA|nr:helix-turn-helix domain-containing protein [Nocardia nova]AHH16457.1 putative transcriptional regulator [Nocardia nova SH22a]
MTTDPPSSTGLPDGVFGPDAVAGIRGSGERPATGLPSGYTPAAWAQTSGTWTAGSYAVLALRISSHRQNPSERAARRAAERIRAALTASCPPEVLFAPCAQGGTVLFPAPMSGGELDIVLERLSAAAEVDLIAACALAAPAGVPDAAEQAHGLLTLAWRLRYPPRVYRLDDLALEYQLTRPGPGRRILGDLLNPLDDHPTLMRTLFVHIGNDLNRRRTARELGVHVHTVDYRLKRIGELTGFNPCSTRDLWYLRSAMVVRRGTASDDRAPDDTTGAPVD